MSLFLDTISSNAPKTYKGYNFSNVWYFWLYQGLSGAKDISDREMKGVSGILFDIHCNSHNYSNTFILETFGQLYNKYKYKVELFDSEVLKFLIAKTYQFGSIDAAFYLYKALQNDIG